MEILKYLDLRRYFVRSQVQESNSGKQIDESKLEALSCALSEERISCIYSNSNRLAYYNLK